MPRYAKGREIQTEGIVLRSRTWGEDDLLVEFLTADEGRVSGLARHGRKSQKRFGTLLESLNIVQILFEDAAGIVSLREASLAVPLVGLRSRLEAILAAFYFVDLIRKSVPERGSDRRLYNLLKESLVSLDGETPAAAAVTRFESAYLEACGITPSLEKCLSCGRGEGEGGKFYFVFREGGVFCGPCLPSGLSNEPFSPDSLPAVLSRFIAYQIGRPLKTRSLWEGC